MSYSSETNNFSFLDIKPSAYIVVDCAGEIIYCNDSLNKIFHINKQTLLRHLFTEFFVQADGDTPLSFVSMRKNLQELESYEIEACIKDSGIKIQPVKLNFKKLSKDIHDSISVKISINTNQTISEKNLLNIINKAQSFKGDIGQVFFMISNTLYEELHGFFIAIKIKTNNDLFYRSGFNIPQELEEQKLENLESSICKPIFTIKKPLVLSNIPQIYPKILDPVIEKYKIVSFLGVPVFNHNQEVIGTLALYDNYERNFGPKDIKIMNIYASRIADELNLEKNAALLEKTHATDSKGTSRFSQIKDVGGYVKKVSGIDIHQMGKIEKKHSIFETTIVDIDKKVKNIPIADEKENQTNYQAPIAPAAPRVPIFKIPKQIIDNIVKWDSVKSVSELSIQGIEHLISIAEKDAIGIGVIQDNKLSHANKVFLDLKECKIEKMFPDITNNNLLPPSKFIQEEKKIMDLNSKEIIDHFFIKMKTLDGNIFTGDITITAITLQNKKSFEITFSKKNPFSMMFGYIGVPLASFSDNKEKNLKDLINDKLKNKSQSNFKDLLDIIYITTQNEA